MFVGFNCSGEVDISWENGFAPVVMITIVVGVDDLADLENGSVDLMGKY